MDDVGSHHQVSTTYVISSGAALRTVHQVGMFNLCCNQIFAEFTNQCPNYISVKALKAKQDAISKLTTGKFFWDDAYHWLQSLCTVDQRRKHCNNASKDRLVDSVQYIDKSLAINGLFAKGPTLSSLLGTVKPNGLPSVEVNAISIAAGRDEISKHEIPYAPGSSE